MTMPVTLENMIQSKTFDTAIDRKHPVKFLGWVLGISEDRRLTPKALRIINLSSYATVAGLELGRGMSDACNNIPYSPISGLADITPIITTAQSVTRGITAFHQINSEESSSSYQDIVGKQLMGASGSAVSMAATFYTSLGIGRTAYSIGYGLTITWNTIIHPLR